MISFVFRKKAFAALVLASVLALALSTDRRVSASDQNAPTAVDEDAGQEPGFLILDGEFVPAPYGVEIVDGALVINGRAVARAVEPAQAIEITDTVAAQYEALKDVHAVFRQLEQAHGLTAARREIVAVLLGQPIVERAHWESENALAVKFRDDDAPEIVEFSPLGDDPTPPEVLAQRFLQDQAAAIQYWLTHGSLVIMQDGALMATSPQNGAETLSKLRELVRTVPDPEARIGAIEQIVPDPRMARAISQNLH